MSFDKLLYLAGPYSFNPEVAFERHTAYAAALLQKGLFVFSPILHNHQLAHTHELPKDATFWQKHNKAMILRCNEVWVMLEPGWYESKGTQYEIGVAEENNVPVRYVALIEGLLIFDDMWQILPKFYRRHPEYAAKDAYAKLLVDRYPLP